VTKSVRPRTSAVHQAASFSANDGHSGCWGSDGMGKTLIAVTVSWQVGSCRSKRD